MNAYFLSINTPSLQKLQLLKSLEKLKVIPIKKFAKSLRLKVSGNKKDLIARVHQHIQLSSYALKIQSLCCKRLLLKRTTCIRIQKWFRGQLFKSLFRTRGPAVLKRKLCNNNTDFLTGDNIQDIDIAQFFSFKDHDGFTYGFDVISIYNLIKSKSLKNPYNRQPLDTIVTGNLNHLIKLSTMLKVPFKYIMVDDQPKPITTISRIHNIFKVIDELGNYTSPAWLLDLNSAQLLRFLRELSDIWNYRSQISETVKRQICPPYGNPFRGYGYFYGDQNILRIQATCAHILESILLRGVDDGSKALGAYFILSALTLVSHSAAQSLPWLYEAVI